MIWHVLQKEASQITKNAHNFSHISILQTACCLLPMDSRSQRLEALARHDLEGKEYTSERASREEVLSP